MAVCIMATSISCYTGFSGWVDSLLGNTTPITSNTTILAVQEGGSFILECNPRTNDPSISTVSAVWTKNHALINSSDDRIISLEGGKTLLVRNFSSGGGNTNVTFQCLFSGLRYLEELERTFVITPAKGQSLTTNALFMCVIVVAASVGAQMSSYKSLSG